MIKKNDIKKKYNLKVKEYLKHNNDILQYRGIFRSCNASVFVEKYKNSDENIYKQLIVNNITAEYTEEFRTHDMIACDKMYTHFTSPIRRFSDCLCHFLLKYIYLDKRLSNIPNPFTEPELKNMIQEVHLKTKQNKKISYLDQKFRKIQAMYCLLQNMNHQKQNKYSLIYSAHPLFIADTGDKVTIAILKDLLLFGSDNV